MVRSHQKQISGTDKGQLRPLIDFYGQQVKRHGNGVGSVAWGSTGSQELRFEVLSRIGDLRGKTILDVGCGLGDYYSWLNRNGINADYEGIDICGDMIDQARKKHPTAKFRTLDLMGMDVIGPQFDYVLASGTFNRRVEDHERFVHDMVKRMFNLCRLGLAFNVMSIQADFKEQDEYYADPKTELAFCRSLTPNVRLDHGYMPHDFTVFMTKGNGE